MKHIPTKRGGNYSHTMRNGTDVYNFSYYDIAEVNKIIIDLKQQNADMLDALIRTERKLSAYVGVCTGDKELLLTVLPMAREAIAKAGGEV